MASCRGFRGCRRYAAGGVVGTGGWSVAVASLGVWPQVVWSVAFSCCVGLLGGRLRLGGCPVGVVLWFHLPGDIVGPICGGGRRLGWRQLGGLSCGVGQGCWYLLYGLGGGWLGLV